jgi:hypothetical protein
MLDLGLNLTMHAHAIRPNLAQIKNLFNRVALEQGSYDTIKTNTYQANKLDSLTRIRIKAPINTVKGQSYVLSWDSTEYDALLNLCDATGHYISQVLGGWQTASPKVFTAEDSVLILFRNKDNSLISYLDFTNSTIQLESGTVAHPYVPYSS